MKKLILLAMVIGLFMSACAHTLAGIQKDYGTPARVEIECIAGTVCDENTYYNNKNAVQYIYWFYYLQEKVPLTWNATQEYCWEIKADRNGKIISNSEYVEQKHREQSTGRTPIQGRRGEKLPGVN